MKKNNNIICPRENLKYIPANDASCSNQGTCLIVPVSIHNVCKNKHLLVIVEVYKDNSFYAREIKKVFTGSKTDNRYSCCCHECNNLIDCLFIDNFEFYFIDNCNPECICIEVKTQYIYDC